eukprot:scaffold45341_cov56-Attheya_sp.AAC.6
MAVGKRMAILSLSNRWTTGVTTARSESHSGRLWRAVRKSAVGLGRACSVCARVASRWRGS